MNCEDFELELGDGELSAAAQAHLDGCARCRETYEVVALAALPEVSATERARLAGVAPAARAAWSARQRRDGWLGRVAGLALAAGLGAVVASAVLLSRPAPAELAVAPQVRTVVLETPSIDFDDASDDSLNLSDDEVFFEVAWPTPDSETEGETP